MFIYTPLPKDNANQRKIRLLTVHEGAGTEIRCSLDTIPLDEAPPYEALSYVWGDPNRTREITLDGKSFQVTTNLASALRHRRDRQKPRTLWVDAVCIDQQNAEERSSQILLMRDVFQRASKVVVWLGESTVASKAAVALIRKVDFGDGSFWEQKENQGPVAFSQDALGGLQMLLNRRSSLVGLRGIINDIASRPWWTRVWVIQEAAVARSIVVRCGSEEMPWWLFCNALSAIATLAPDLSGPSTERLILFKKRLSIHETPHGASRTWSPTLVSWLLPIPRIWSTHSWDSQGILVTHLAILSVHQTTRLPHPCWMYTEILLHTVYQTEVWTLFV